MIESDRTALLAILSRWQRHWLHSSRLTEQKARIEAEIANAAAAMVNAEAGLRVFGYDVTQEGVWNQLGDLFRDELSTFMANEDRQHAEASSNPNLDGLFRDFQNLMASDDAKKPPMPTIREIALMRLREAGETGSKARAIREYIQATYGVECHEKTVGMTLYRLQQDRMVRRDGHIWFFVPPPAETGNPGVAAPGL